MRWGTIRQGWGKAAIAAAAACASLAPAASAPDDRWTADPDSQFVLDVLVHNLKIGDGVRAYQTPEGACILFGDFVKTLDFPIKTDFATGRASGWAFDQKNVYDIDRRTQTVTVKGKREAFATSDIRETPDGWCVDDRALGRWFGMTAKADVFNSLLKIDTDRKLPIEETMLRRQRGDSLAYRQKAALALAGAPMVRLPYRMWRAPAFEFVVSGGVRYAQGRMETGRDASIAIAGELAAMSYSANIGLNANGVPQTLWARLYRSDPEGHLLGPLKATHIALGDVPGLSSAFSAASSSGRGVVITNRPLSQSGNFDRTEFRGRMQEGWDAELYRNGQLVGYDTDPGGTGEYVFKDVEILADDNEYEVILHGPQGQIESQSEHINVGKDHAPPGKLWYWAGIRQVGENLVDLSRLFGKQDRGQTAIAPTNGRFGPPPEATVQLQYGIDRKMSVSALVRTLIASDERVTYAEGSVRRTIGVAVVDLAGSINSARDKGVKAQVLAKIGRASVTAISTFHAYGAPDSALGIRPLSEHRLAGAIPLKLGKMRIPVSASVGKRSFTDGSGALDASLRLATRVGQFSLANATTYQKTTSRDLSGAQISTQTLVNQLIGTGRIGAVRVRGSLESDILPKARLRALELEGTLATREDREWVAGVRYDLGSKIGAAQISHVRRFDNLAVAVIGEAQTDGTVAAKVRLNFSLDPFHRGLKFSRDRLASTGLVQARVFEDLNENGTFDDGEPVAKNAMITTGTKISEKTTDDQGKVIVGGLSPFTPTAVGIDQSSLDNPALTPLKPVQVVVPRPGVAATVDIALVGGGSIEAFAAKADGTPYEGVEFELVEGDGTVIAATRSDLDGYIVFENVHYGAFSLRLSKSSAAAINAAAMAPVAVRISRDKPAARLGAIAIASLH